MVKQTVISHWDWVISHPIVLNLSIFTFIYHLHITIYNVIMMHKLQHNDAEIHGVT